MLFYAKSRAKVVQMLYAVVQLWPNLFIASPRFSPNLPNFSQLLPTSSNFFPTFSQLPPIDK